MPARSRMMPPRTTSRPQAHRPSRPRTHRPPQQAPAWRQRALRRHRQRPRRPCRHHRHRRRTLWLPRPCLLGSVGRCWERAAFFSAVRLCVIRPGGGRRSRCRPLPERSPQCLVSAPAQKEGAPRESHGNQVTQEPRGRRRPPQRSGNARLRRRSRRRAGAAGRRRARRAEGRRGGGQRAVPHDERVQVRSEGKGLAPARAAERAAGPGFVPARPRAAPCAGPAHQRAA